MSVLKFCVVLLLMLGQGRLRADEAPEEKPAVAIYGQVLRQGTREFDPSKKLTVSQAIMQIAGGVGPYADIRRVRLLRTTDGQTHVFAIDLREIVNGHAESDQILKPNDKIIVHEKWQTTRFWFFEALPDFLDAALPGVHWDGVTVEQAVDEVARRLAQLDPSKKGLKIEIHHTDFSSHARLHLDLPKTTMNELLSRVAFLAQLGWRVEGSAWIFAYPKPQAGDPVSEQTGVSARKGG